MAREKLNIPIAKTEFDDKDFQAQLKPLKSGWIVQGPYVKEFEKNGVLLLALNIPLLLLHVRQHYICHSLL